jgi:hypothetical protein
MAIYSLLTLGSTVIGGPFVGWICQHFSPRAGLGLAGVATVVTASVLAAPLLRSGNAEVSASPVQPAVDLAN